MGVSRAIAESDITVPGRWQAFYEPLQVSSRVFYQRLSVRNHDVEEELRRIEKRLGRRRLYSDSEIEELQDKIEDIQI